MFSQYSSGVRPARAGALTLIIALLFLITSAACKRSGVESDSNANSSSHAANDPSTTPPFSTKEPERYQWRSVTSVSLGDQATPAGAQEEEVQPNTTEVFVARDGDRRREDYELSPGMKISFLQLPTGRYRLLHSKKLYAELGDGERAGGAPPPPTPTQHAPPDFSPDKLNASRTEARYEKLGAEEVNGRMATKYRVTIRSAAGETKEAAAVENLVWVDESLGVPVKTETASSNGARYTMELRDIKLEVDASLFALPPDYKRVESKEIDTEMLSTYLLGGDADENDTKAKGK
jgi:hypothetical protein